MSHGRARSGSCSSKSSISSLTSSSPSGWFVRCAPFATTYRLPSGDLPRRRIEKSTDARRPALPHENSAAVLTRPCRAWPRWRPSARRCRGRPVKRSQFSPRKRSASRRRVCPKAIAAGSRARRAGPTARRAKGTTCVDTARGCHSHSASRPRAARSSSASTSDPADSTQSKTTRARRRRAFFAIALAIVLIAASRLRVRRGLVDPGPASRLRRSLAASRAYFVSSLMQRAVRLMAQSASPTLISPSMPPSACSITWQWYIQSPGSSSGWRP